MTGTTHRLAGISAGMAAVEILQMNDLKIQTALLTGCIIGSLLPDIDNPQSTISYKVPCIRAIYSLLQKMIRIFADLLPGRKKEYVKSSIGHRGLTHSLFTAFALPALILGLGKIVSFQTHMLSLGLMLGLLSHILLDLFSGGIRLFLPFSPYNVKMARIKTGGALEWIIRIGFMMVLSYLTIESIKELHIIDSILEMIFSNPPSMYTPTLEEEILWSLW